MGLDPYWTHMGLGLGGRSGGRAVGRRAAGDTSIMIVGRLVRSCVADEGVCGQLRQHVLPATPAGQKRA